MTFRTSTADDPSSANYRVENIIGVPTNVMFRIVRNGGRFQKFIRYCNQRTMSMVNAKLQNGPGLKEFLIAGKNLPDPKKVGGTGSDVPYLLGINDLLGNGRKVYFEVYGCQMNVSDTEVVWAILQKSGYLKVEDIKAADVVMIITCAIREGAETKVNFLVYTDSVP